MFCRSCGKELTGIPDFCLNCGAKPLAGTSYCPRCGAPTTPLAEMCAKCDTRVAEPITKRTWKPTGAGILCIIGGIIGLLSGIFWALLVLVLMGDPAVQGPEELPMAIVGYWMSGGIADIMAIVGGIYALRRRIWGLALAGSICALFCIPFGNHWVFTLTIPAMLAGFTIMAIPGILAIIFVVRGKREFERGARVAKELAGDISPKSRLATTLLAFFLGVFGAHRFYIGKTRTAIVMLLLSIGGPGIVIAGGVIAQGDLGGFVGLLSSVYVSSFLVAVGIWAFVDFMFAVTGHMKDREGRLVRKW